MKKFILPISLFTLATLTACTSYHRHYEPSFSGTVTHAHYVCEDGTLLPVDFESRVAVAYLSDDDKVILDPQPVASGFHYSSGYFQLRGKGRHADWTVGTNPPVACRA